MSEATELKKAPEKGMWECEYLALDKEKRKNSNFPKKGTKVTFHASTAATLAKKGIIKILKEVKVYIPKTMKE